MKIFINTKYIILLLLGVVFLTSVFSQENTNNADEYLYYIYTNGRYGFINNGGEIVIAPIYYGKRCFSEGMVAVSNASGSLGFVSSSGEVISPKYYRVRPFSEGLAAVHSVSESGAMHGWAYIDKHGNEVISGMKMRSCSIFSQGLAAVTLQVPGKSWLLQGYIDKTGKTTISPRFNWGYGFTKEGTALVQCHYLMDPEYKDQYMVN